MSFVSFCTGIIAWIILGYSFAFSEGNQFIGGFDYFMLNGITPQDGEGIPQLLDVMFQGTFAAIAVAIVSGSIIERVKFLHGRFSHFYGFFWCTHLYVIGFGDQKDFCTEI